MTQPAVLTDLPDLADLPLADILQERTVLGDAIQRVLRDAEEDPGGAVSLFQSVI